MRCTQRSSLVFLETTPSQNSMHRSLQSNINVWERNKIATSLFDRFFDFVSVLLFSVPSFSFLLTSLDFTILLCEVTTVHVFGLGPLLTWELRNNDAFWSHNVLYIFCSYAKAVTQTFIQIFGNILHNNWIKLNTHIVCEC